MENIRPAIEFEGLENTARHKDIARFLQREFSLDESRLRALMTNPPYILAGKTIKGDGEETLRALTKLGCRCRLSPMIFDSVYPFPLLERHFRIINKELSKILRTGATMTLSIIRIASPQRAAALPSLMGPLEKRIEEFFRNSDTVIGIDYDGMIVIGFATDKQGVPRIENKVRRVLKQCLGDDDMIVTIGSAVFPLEGNSIRELLTAAESRRIAGVQKPAAAIPAAAIPAAVPGAPLRAAQDTEDAPAPPNMVQQCIIQARGKLFLRLMRMDRPLILAGIKQLSSLEQTAFLNRLPFDYPHVTWINEMMSISVSSGHDRSGESQFAAIIDQMGVTEIFAKRAATQRALLAKLRQVEALPTLPSIAAHILDIATDPDTSRGNLAKVIGADPSLTAKLLKIVNSAFYGFPKEIGALDQALMILGTDEIMNLTIALAASNVFNIRTERCVYPPKALWHHSICTATIASRLFRNCTAYEVHTVFTAGLLHDIGKIFLLEHFMELYAEIVGSAMECKFSPYEFEEDACDLNHGNIGERLAGMWNMPSYYLEAIAHHHHPERAVTDAKLAAVIGLADYLYHDAVSNDGGELAGEAPPSLHAHLNIGQWNILKDILPDLEASKLQSLREDALTIVKNSGEMLNLVQ